MTGGLIASPTGGHVDPWGVSLGIAAVAAWVLGSLRRRSILRHWRHHPFRMAVERHVANSLIGAGCLLGVAAVAHLLGWPVYDVPLFGFSAFAILAVAIVGGQVTWRTHFLPMLARYDSAHPEVARPDLKRPRVAQPAELPLWTAALVGSVAFAAFLWHPWAHLFHEGNFLIGGLGGFVIGSVISMHTSRIPQVPVVRSRR